LASKNLASIIYTLPSAYLESAYLESTDLESAHLASAHLPPAHLPSAAALPYSRILPLLFRECTMIHIWLKYPTVETDMAPLTLKTSPQ
jgi:hypothetical protein